jgi:VCBS repeat-containing protein
VATLCTLGIVPAFASAAFGPPAGPTTPPFWQCPAVGSSTSCSFLIELTGSSTNPTVTVYGDPSQEFYDPGKDDQIVAVQNQTDGPIARLHIGVPGSGDRLFSFDGDGLCNPGLGAIPAGCPFGGAGNTSDPFDYYGPDMSVEPGYTADDGTVDFTPVLQPSQYTFFGLEAPLNSEVAVPVGAGNDYVSGTLSDAGDPSNHGAQVTRVTPGNFTDQAQLSGVNAASAAGTISYKVYSDPSCNSLVADATPAADTVSGGTIPASMPVGAALATNAIYYWQVTFTSNDTTLNSNAVNACGGETMTFGTPPPRPTTGVITTLFDGTHSGPQLSVPAGTAVTDSARISGTAASTATGTMTYSIFSDSACTTQVDAFPAHGDIRQVATGAAPASAAVTLPLGTYYFRATYSGDVTHASAIGTCGAEVLAVKQPTTLVTALSSLTKRFGTSATVPPGTLLTDTATVRLGGTPVAATGSVLYTLYNGARDPQCTKAPAASFTGTVVAGSAVPFRPASLRPGKWLIVATYTGDSDFLAAVSPCGSETVVVVPASLSVGRPKISAGGTITNHVTSNTGGTFSITGAISNASAALARAKGCGAGKVKIHGRCVSNSFGHASLAVTAAGTYVIKLVPNQAARRALGAGRTLRVAETITLRPGDGSAAAVRVVRVTVRGRRHRH